MAAKSKQENAQSPMNERKAEVSVILEMNPIIQGQFNESILMTIKTTITNINQDKRLKSKEKRELCKSLNQFERKLLRIKHKKKQKQIKNDPWIAKMRFYHITQNDVIEHENILEKSRQNLQNDEKQQNDDENKHIDNNLHNNNKINDKIYQFGKKIQTTLIEKEYLIENRLQKIRIIFLDIDGVLNDSNQYDYLYKSHLDLLKKLVDSLEDVKIIVSSSWREDVLYLYQLLGAMHEIGIDYEKVVIGCTPFKQEQFVTDETTQDEKKGNIDGNDGNDKNIRKRGVVNRSDEINKWFNILTKQIQQMKQIKGIKQQTDKKLATTSNTNVNINDNVNVNIKYVILDDIHLKGNDYIDGHFVQTSIQTGLTQENVDNAIKILTSH